MQRNIHIPLNKMPMEDLQRVTERALTELEQMLNAKVANYENPNPHSTILRIDETTNHLFVYNTSTREWAEYVPV